MTSLGTSKDNSTWASPISLMEPVEPAGRHTFLFVRRQPGAGLGKRAGSWADSAYSYASTVYGGIFA
jgi:hypothetical protein